MMTIDEMINVLSAYKNGEKIQVRDIGGVMWNNCVNPHWQFNLCDYRVAPKGMSYRPYKDTTEMIKDFDKRFPSGRSKNTMPLIWLKSKKSDYIGIVEGFEEAAITIHSGMYDMTDIFEMCTYLDGSPVGKKA